MITIIMNPIAGSGRTMDEISHVEALLKSREIMYEIVRTTRAGEAVEIAKQACEKGSEIGAMGGDGTFFEVLNGMAGHKNVLYFIPSGTGNDFIKTIGLPNDPVKALEMQLDNEISEIDYGIMNDTCFLNVSGIGFDVMVLREADSFKKHFHGLLPYLFGLIKALKAFKPIQCNIAVDDAPSAEKTLTILSIGNGQYIGGGMRAVPGGDPWSGTFACSMVDPVSKPMVMRFLPKFIKGEHVRMPVTKVFNCKKLELICPGMTVNLDGELRDVDHAVFRIIQRGLSVRCRKPVCCGE